MIVLAIDVFMQHGNIYNREKLAYFQIQTIMIRVVDLRELNECSNYP
jgi:hypothetical protein